MAVAAKLPRGLRDVLSGDVLARQQLVSAVTAVYHNYGFDALETPVFEHAHALGAYLPDVDRPSSGVFVFTDEDDTLALRYDLTAPLARYVAANSQTLPKPCRLYRSGVVFRNEKPGPGRFREFMQLDADTVGSSSPRADAEMLLLSADALAAAGLAHSDYVIKVSDRRLLDAVCEKAGLENDDARRAIVLRALDKIDRLGRAGVAALLGAGRRDASGDFTQGANLTPAQADIILAFVDAQKDTAAASLAAVRAIIGHDHAAVLALEAILNLVAHDSRIVFAPSIVRGLGYYTGTVFEGELTFSVPNEQGENVVFGSVLGGGRYDNLVSKFTNQPMPAVGMSVGVDRLLTAQRLRGLATPCPVPPVLVCVPGPSDAPYAAQLTHTLRQAGIRAECYVGDSGLKAQFKYADKRHCPLVLIAGSQEVEQGVVQIKDMLLGKELSQTSASRDSWCADRPAQVAVPAHNVVAEVQNTLRAQGFAV